MTEVSQVSRVENSSNAEQSRADGSFNEKLEKAQTDLKNKTKNLISSKTWERLESLVGFLPLNFNFTTNIDADYGAKNQSKEAQKISDFHKDESWQSSLTSQRDPSNAQQDNNFILNNVKDIKEALIKFIPNPTIIPTFFLGNLEANTNVNTVSKIDLQILIDKIVEQAKLVKSQRRVELSLLLKEEQLGNIGLSFASHNGLISIQISASSELRKSLQDSVDELEEALDLANIKFDQIKIVEVQEHDGNFFAG
ncbi:hypothetical protein A2526_02140 [candidate division WOR-1 bacterium RIFOXYD2_FULL_36_8]|uniref:Flagellar hook-length control protein-like C-terminal domain-containing protein n=1 Tax=candidate division WOR-1 bacterium RIFOXYB2_FULL_36_35 TaxID=1802578 RepID=A0A1F4S285_UNCSA|nr:MAG: hypothetical protein A2230_06220 [candidate division WOR-1 bacterium RIFOXYA2_FULL_36_21]OGC14555.1 MAG: hypothetical protein A2290_01740 [candidate division WOR-1 bacterium RIFOXYB2_FULL_36_35]OGC16227.1 MAG: hypothetical protein A2282_01295 [candidate division WOR-1 bacterium RIFOXYA12_FULL_36_13]OGC38329.1 MAG: hypothetical protein A2526_02140 [candidate division WOR-1 bacterium RIFOXYD2_FULL_36_8]